MERVTQEIEISDFDNLDDTVNDRDGTEEEDIDEADESIDEDLLQEGVDDTVEKYISAEVYKCTKCDSQYSLEAVLKVHMEQKHKNEKMFSCKYCDWQSDYKYNLERHIKNNMEATMKHRIMKLQPITRTRTRQIYFLVMIVIMQPKKVQLGSTHKEVALVPSLNY